MALDDLMRGDDPCSGGERCGLGLGTDSLSLCLCPRSVRPASCTPDCRPQRKGASSPLPYSLAAEAGAGQGDRSWGQRAAFALSTASPRTELRPASFRPSPQPRAGSRRDPRRPTASGFCTIT